MEESAAFGAARAGSFFWERVGMMCSVIRGAAAITWKNISAGLSALAGDCCVRPIASHVYPQSTRDVPGVLKYLFLVRLSTWYILPPRFVFGGFRTTLDLTT